MGAKHEQTKDLVYRAIEELKRGNVGDALAILEQTVRPKWFSSNACHQEYWSIQLKRTPEERGQ
jgi:hypothetical protein